MWNEAQTLAASRHRRHEMSNATAGGKIRYLLSRTRSYYHVSLLEPVNAKICPRIALQRHESCNPYGPRWQKRARIRTFDGAASSSQIALVESSMEEWAKKLLGERIITEIKLDLNTGCEISNVSGCFQPR